MKYTHMALVAASLLFAGSAYAQTQQKLTINAATVFISGAELESSAKLSLVKGENEFLLTNVAGNINSQSLTVSASNDVVVESATFQNNYLDNNNLTPAAQAIKDSIELVNGDLQLITNKITTVSEQVTILQENRKVSGNANGLSVAELQKMLDLINAKMEGLLNQKNKYENQQKKINDHLARLNHQLEEEQKKQYQPGGQLLVKFYAKDAATTAVDVKYVIQNAGWSPTYDIWGDNATDPVRLYYKANVYQNSGVKWNNVKLTLSTGNPEQGADAPVLNPWYLAFYTPMPEAPMARMYKAKDAMPDTNTVEDPSTGQIAMAIATRNNEATISQYVQVDNTGVNTSFDIDLPYTIPSDGQPHLIAVKKYQLPATYRYYTVPKLDNDVFLQAQITNWEDLNLLPAPTNIFYEGTYVGQGYIDARNLHDTMTISMGRDKKIVVKREQDKKMHVVKTLGSNVRETYGYTITIRNTRKEAVHLIVQDQFPVTTDKDISIEDKDAPDAEIDDATGAVKWNISLNPNETKKLEIGYTVKYPKGKIINNLH